MPESRTADGRLSLVMLALLSLLAGAATGLVGALFRLALVEADNQRNVLLSWAHGLNLPGLVLLVALGAAATAVAARLVRRFAPEASGSGIPHVEAVLDEALPPAPARLIPVKFVGGVLAIGAGLALGREGPSVQMGATLAHLLGKVCRRPWPDCRILLAAGAGAGLATAFNAPIAGAVFVLEELVRRFDTRLAIATFGTSASAIAVTRIFLGRAPDFQVAPLPYPALGTLPLFMLLGIVAGLLGVVYNRTLLGAITASERLGRWSVETRAAVVGAAVMLLAWFAPDLVGGGDTITQSTLQGTQTVTVLALVFLLRLGLGAVSYAARTPGGLFAPLLVLGAESGLICGLLVEHWLPELAPHPVAFAIVGMAAFFAAVVRAPVTGMVLVVEMTANFTLLLPMLGACFTAMLVPTLLRDLPIYEALQEPGQRR